MNGDSMFDGRYWFSPEVCERQLKEAKRIIIFLEHLIRDNCSDDSAWKSELNAVLCDYYSHANSFQRLMSDILLSELHLNEVSEKEEFLLTMADVELMKMQAQTILLDDNTLFVEHGVSLTVH